MYHIRGAAYFLPTFCRDASSASLSIHSPLWTVLNPSNASSVVHVNVDTPYKILVGASPVGLLRAALSAALASSAFVILHLVFPPVIATSSLYILLRHLLRDQQFLEDEKQKAAEQRARHSQDEAMKRTSRAQGRLLDYSTNADVELVASTEIADSPILTWSIMHSHIAVHSTSSSFQKNQKARRLSIPRSTGALQHLTLNADGSLCAAASQSGKIFIWDVESGALFDFSVHQQHDSSVVPVSLLFTCSLAAGSAPPKAGRVRTKQHDTTFFVARTDGTVSAWDTCGSTVEEVISAPRSPSPNTRFYSLPDSQSLARCTTDGRIELWRYMQQTWSLSRVLHSPVNDDTVVHMLSFNLKGSTSGPEYLCTCSSKGHVYVWHPEEDHQSYYAARVFEGDGLQVQRACVMSSSTTCPCSPDLPHKGILLVHSFGSIVHIQQLFLPSTESRCRCASLNSVSGQQASSIDLNPASPLNQSYAAQTQASLTKGCQLKRSWSREIAADPHGAWDQLGSSLVVAGVGKSTEIDGFPQWKVWSIDLAGPQGRTTRCLEGRIAYSDSPYDCNGVLRCRCENNCCDNGLRNRKRTRRRDDPLNTPNTPESFAPQLIFSSIRSLSKSGTGLATSYGNAVLLIEPPSS